jgi:trehalose 6-phosphate synthase/phosphatase
LSLDEDAVLIPLDDEARRGITRSFAGARRRVVFLDYDGTLRELAPSPELAAPTPEIYRLLARLAALPATTVHLVSGRARTTMEAWFGTLPIVLHAEHAYVVREPGGDWRPVVEVDLSWLPGIERALRRAASAVPGAVVERKDSSVAWHYRQADPATARIAVADVLATLEPLVGATSAQVVRGRRVLEVRARGVDKGKAVGALATTGVAEDDVVLAAGDDTTDLDLYRALPAQAIVFHVGDARLHAALPRPAYRVASPCALRELLDALVTAAVGGVEHAPDADAPA